MGQTITCFSCGARVPAIDGPTHRYMLSSPGCWALFGEVLAREYGDATLMAVHQLTVDAYAVQHPGDGSPPAVRSVGLHLIGLCAVVEHGQSPHVATRLIKRGVERAMGFPRLAPPEDLGRLTIADVHPADEPVKHRTAVRNWAEAAWWAWSAHHETVRRWFVELSA